MRVKKFVGKTMQEAVDSLKKEFGRDAVVLHTTQRRRWLWGRFGPKRYEVLGAIDPNHRGPQTTAKPHIPEPRVLSEKTLNQDTSRFDPSLSEAVQNLYGRLIRRDIPKDVTQTLLKDVLTRLPQQEWNDEGKIWTALNRLVDERITTVDPWEFSGGQRVVALVGECCSW
jgi:flagellar biosynthesis GTPase FlhF